MTPTVALTFDDGPSEWTPGLLEVLAAADARATFFVLGCHIAGREETLREIVREGHQIGLHGWDHQSVHKLTHRELRQQVRRSRQAVKAVCDVTPVLWRSPWHRTPQGAVRVLKKERLRIVGADLDVCDTEATEELIVGRALAGLADGVIVGLHDGVAPNGRFVDASREPTVRAVARLLEQCRSVTVSELR